jgi:hypothetical protein
MEFTITPALGYKMALSQISFAARSTGTGAATWSLRSNKDDYATDIATNTIATNSTWALTSASGLTFENEETTTFRIYLYGGSGSPATGTINTRLDDIRLSIKAETLPAGFYVDREEIAFGDQIINTTSAIQTLVVAGIDLPESIHGEFTWTGDKDYFDAIQSDDWDINTGGTINVTFTPTTTGEKTATLTITSGDFSKQITLTGTGTPSSSIETIVENNVVLYPNPVKDILYIQAEQAIAKVEILSLSGQLVAQQNGDKNSMNVSNLATGTYLIRITFDNGVTLSRVIVK